MERDKLIRRTVVGISAGALVLGVLSQAIPSQERSEKVEKPGATREVPKIPSFEPAPIRLETPKPGWNRFNSEFGYGIDYPPDWSKPEDYGVNQTTLESIPHNPNSPRITILKEITAYGTQTYGESVAEDLAIENKEIRSQLKFKIDNEEAVSFVKIDSRDNSEINVLVIVKNKKGYTVIIELKSEEFAKQKETLQQILNSFRVLR